MLKIIGITLLMVMTFMKMAPFTIRKTVKPTAVK